MKLSKLHKTNNCPSSTCPAAYEAPGGYVIQGTKIPNLPGTVEVPSDVLDRLNLTIDGPAVTVIPGGYRVAGGALDTETAAQLTDIADYETAVYVETHRLGTAPVGATV